MEVLTELLNEKFKKFNQLDFIENDPISIPHQFSRKQDIEIAAFFAAILAWGNRTTIIKKCNELMDRMDQSPFDFMKNPNFKTLAGFKHRTFNEFDLFYFIDFLNRHYSKYDSLEDAFLQNEYSSENIEPNLISFRNYFFKDIDHNIRTMKHISTPAKNSACKRLNMFLRWMVRKDTVDFGLWKKIKPSQLIIPCDLHVENIARKLKLTQRKKADWKMATEITDALRKIDHQDPVKYDFALFGMGIEGYFDVKTQKH